jgi:hypothetical protein
MEKFWTTVLCLKEFWVTLLSIAAGAVGYIVVTFWVQPILRYRDIKYQVAADLVFFANALELQKQNGKLRNDTLARQDNNRRCAAELKAICPQLPFWYRCKLRLKKENPTEGWKDLIGLSNSSKRDEAQRIHQARKEKSSDTGMKANRPNKRVESDSLRRRFAPPPLAAHAQLHGLPPVKPPHSR